MRSRIFLILVILINGCSAKEHDISSERVALYAKVWGFLKYFHPDVTAGKVNWDSVFVAGINEAENPSNFQNSIDKLIASAGGVKSYGWDSTKREDVLQLADLRWLDDPLLSTETQHKLHSIYSNQVPSHSRYVHGYVGTGNPVFYEDTTYVDAFPDLSHRLLAVARYWNAVEYFYPDLNLISHWEDTLSTYSQRISNVHDAIGYQLTMLKLCCSIRDAHSFTNGPPELKSALGRYYLPLKLTFIGRSIVFLKPITKDTLPINRGDLILAIGGEPIKSLIDRKSLLVPRSNEASMMRNVCGAIIRRQTNDSTEITIQGKDNLVRKVKIAPILDSILRDRADTLIPESTIHFGDSIGYINVGKLKLTPYFDTMQAFRTKRAIIFDLRQYPSLSAWEIGDYLFPKLPWAFFSTPNYGCPGSVVTTPPSQQESSSRSANDMFKFSGKVIVIVNAGTQSAGEYAAMMLRSIEGSIIIGSQTAGADGNVSTIVLPGSIKTIFSGLGVFYWDGRPTQSVGIVPDIEVNQTIEGIRAGRDELLERALKIAESEK